MLTVVRCREILGADCRLSDAEVEQLRDFVYGFADLALRVARENHDEGRSWNSRRQRWEERQAERLPGGRLLPGVQPRAAQGPEPGDAVEGVHRLLPFPGDGGGGGLRGAGRVGKHDRPDAAPADADLLPDAPGADPLPGGLHAGPLRAEPVRPPRLEGVSPEARDHAAGGGAADRRLGDREADGRHPGGVQRVRQQRPPGALPSI